MREIAIVLAVALILVGLYELIRKLRDRRHGAERQAEAIQPDADRLWTRWQWSQDGWIRKDLLTGLFQYGGEGEQADDKGPIL